MTETNRNRFGYVQRKDSGYFGQRMLKMEHPGRKKRGSMAVVKEDMQRGGVTKEAVRHR